METRISTGVNPGQFVIASEAKQSHPHRVLVAMALMVCSVVSVFAGPLPVAAVTYQIPIEISVPVAATSDAEPTKAYNRLVLGVHPEATEGYDPQWDTPAFFTTPDPENPPLLKAHIAHPEYASNQRELWRDIRSDAGGRKRTWDLTISLSPSEIGKIVTVAWTLPPSLQASREKVTLSDPESDTTLDMRAQTSYRFVNGSSSPKTLLVAITPSSGSSDHASSGFFGCGVIGIGGSSNDPGPWDGGTLAALLVNLLILLSPLGIRFRAVGIQRD